MAVVPPVSNQNPNPLRAAIYRFAAAFLALIFVVIVLVFVPSLDATLKVLLIGLGGAAILSIEEYIKSSQGL